MRIGFIGDVHGSTLHALGLAVGWQARTGSQLDALIQVGDFGAFRSEAVWHQPGHEYTLRYVQQVPSQRDFFRVLEPSPELAEALRRCMDLLPGPRLFLRGNAEDHEWLTPLNRPGSVQPVDPRSVFSFVGDGTVLDIGGLQVGFLGGIEAPGQVWNHAPEGVRALADRTDPIDVLVTHDGPHGMSRSFANRLVGSRAITRLIDQLQPAWHVSGHYHHINGPRIYGQTVSYALSNLVAHKDEDWLGRVPPNPDQHVAPGSLGVLDTDSSTFTYVTEPWITEVRGDTFDLAGYLATLGV